MMYPQEAMEKVIQERDAARRETEVLRPVVEAALVLVEEWPLRATPNGGELGLAVAVKTYRAALASLPSSTPPSEDRTEEDPMRAVQAAKERGDSRPWLAHPDGGDDR